jgi:hypothetical protein
MDVREAARRTLVAGGARVWRRGFLDPPGKPSFLAFFLMLEEGVADLPRRRARLRMLETPEAGAFIERMASKWPWLEEGWVTDEEPGERTATIMIGARRYVQRGERWHLAEHESQLGNPAWILDTLAGARGAARIGSEDVRDVSCERYALEPVDLRAAVRASGGRLELPLHGSIENPTLQGNVWIDGNGLIRRVTWSQTPWGRSRQRDRQAPHRLWQTVELWDFGLAVEIEEPKPEPRPDEPGPSARQLLEFGRSLWRKRAEYRRGGRHHSTRTS